MSETKNAPSRAVKALIVVALVAAVSAVLLAKSASRNGEANTQAADAATTVKPTPNSGGPVANGAAKPRLLELGSVTCIPCKMMAPILEELKAEYAGKLDVEFIDVWKDGTAGKKYDVNLIPTQIFFDASGKELFRHQGFFAKADILAKWQELGADLGQANDQLEGEEPSE